MNKADGRMVHLLVVAWWCSCLNEFMMNNQFCDENGIFESCFWCRILPSCPKKCKSLWVCCRLACPFKQRWHNVKECCKHNCECQRTDDNSTWTSFATSHNSEKSHESCKILAQCHTGKIALAQRVSACHQLSEGGALFILQVKCAQKHPIHSIFIVWACVSAGPTRKDDASAQA